MSGYRQIRNYNSIVKCTKSTIYLLASQLGEAPKTCSLKKCCHMHEDQDKIKNKEEGEAEPRS